MLRALASHQCGPVSNPGVYAICGLSLLMVLSLSPRGFSPGHSGFPLSSKTNTSKFQFDQESGRRRTTLWICYLQIIIYYLLEFVWERSKHFSFGVSDRFINSHNLFLLIVYWTLLGENCCWSLLGLKRVNGQGCFKVWNCYSLL